MTKTSDLEKQANEIMAKAKEMGAESNYFFVTTFERYRVQIDILLKLEKEIQEGGALVEKEYVKGRKNVYTNPAISEYNKTATAANGTVTTLLKILTTLFADNNEDELEKFLNDSI